MKRDVPFSLPALSVLEDLVLPWKPAPGTAVMRMDRADALKESAHVILSKNEQALFTNLKGEKRRISFIAGRMAAKHCVFPLLDTTKPKNVSLCDIDLLRNEGGALSLAVLGILRPDISVSISHSGDFAFAGAMSSWTIGVDVEPVSEKCSTLKDAFAVPEEVKILKNAWNDDTEQALSFTRLFSAKEAAAKCLGTHMYYAFHHYRLVSVEKEMLVLQDLSQDLSKDKKRFSVQTYTKDNHVFSILVLSLLRS